MTINPHHNPRPTRIELAGASEGWRMEIRVTVPEDWRTSSDECASDVRAWLPKRSWFAKRDSRMFCRSIAWATYAVDATPGQHVRFVETWNDHDEDDWRALAMAHKFFAANSDRIAWMIRHDIGVIDGHCICATCIVETETASASQVDAADVSTD